MKLTTSGETLSIPVRYLSPVPPTELGQNAIALDDSDSSGDAGTNLKGKMVSVIAEGEVEGSWVVTQDGAEFYEIMGEHLIVKSD